MKKISGPWIIKTLVTLTFLSSMLFANFFSVKMMLNHGVQTYLYDKLLVALEIGGKRGLQLELNKILATDKIPIELKMAKEFAGIFPGLTDPEPYLKDKVQKSKNTVNLIRNLRSVAIVMMLLIFAWQSIVNFLRRQKAKDHKI